MFNNTLLATWSAAGIIWWIIAWRLAARKSAPPVSLGKSSQTLSVFKPLPPLGAAGLEAIAAGLESFAAQLDSNSEMLIGVHEADRDLTAPFLKQLHRQNPAARIKVIFRSEPDGMANPKIAWQNSARARSGGRTLALE